MATSMRALFLGLMAALTVAGRSAGEDPTPARANPAAGDLSVAKFYTGSVTQTGNFPGKLVCLRCDLAPGPGAGKQCAESGHRQALAAQEGGAIYPLIAGSDAVLAQINSDALHGKEVIVQGILYPSTGIIFVNRVDAKS